jgi:hypothetical protein
MITSDSSFPQSEKRCGTVVVDPSVIQLIDMPESSFSVKVAITNGTEIPLELDSPGIARFRKPGFISRGIKEGFAKSSGDFASRLIALGKRLEDEVTLDVKYFYTTDFATLNPGASCVVEIHFNIPKSATPVEDWSARIPLFGKTVPVTLSVKAKNKKKRLTDE